MEMEYQYELPQECWERIFSFLDYHHLESLSLVNKLFLRITNSLRTHFSAPSLPALTLLTDHSSLARRFPNLTSLHVSLNGCPPLHLLLLPALTSLSLPYSFFPLGNVYRIAASFPKLKSLIMPQLQWVLQDDDLIAISGLVPSLEELDIGYPCRCSVTEGGLTQLFPKLKRLKKIVLSGNPFVSDTALLCLSTHCVELRELWVKDCSFVTQKGIATIIRNRPELEGLYVSDLGFPAVSSEIIPAFKFARGLTSFDFSSSAVSDELLAALSDANLPLRKLVLSKSCGFTFYGLMELLTKCRQIEILDLHGVSILSDDQVAAICEVLRNLIWVDFSQCLGLTNGIVYSLARYCPLLREIKMDELTVMEWSDKLVGRKVALPNDGNTNIVVNYQVKSLSMTTNPVLDDDYLKQITHLLPNLQNLDVSHCRKITVEGLSAVLKGCSRIEHLNITQCLEIANFPVDKDVLPLEVLVAQGVGLDGHDLGMIARRCPRLRRIDLKGCPHVTTEGVKQLIENCILLREISLKWCGNVDVDIVPWMIFKRPSLRRIDPPRGFAPSANQIVFFLRHGCLVEV